jgi:3-hydroxybutyryl-CoA dehydrogenase
MAAIRTIAVIGAGPPGRSIAQLSALGGFRTILEDILPASLRRAESQIRGALDRAVASGALERSAAEAALARLEFAASIEQAAREADLVIECVPDELESKLEIFTLLDKVARPAAIFASTTSSLSVTELASVTYRAKKILGFRFSVSTERTELLEIVRARETAEETMMACLNVARSLAGKVIVTEEMPRYGDGEAVFPPRR